MTTSKGANAVRSAALAAIVLALVASGCAKPATRGPGAKADNAVEAIDGVRSLFSATYSLSDGGKATLTLEGPATIMDRDGTLRLAYPLQVALANTSAMPGPLLDPWPETIYLDGDLRVVRADAPCWVSNGETDSCGIHHLVSWRSQGALPPFGLGLLGSIQGTEVRYGLGGEIKLPVNVEHRDGAVVVEVPDGAPRAAESLVLAPAGTYVFENGSWLPSALSLRFGFAKQPIEARLVDYRAIGDLPRVPAWPIERASNALGRPGGFLFPGADEDLFGRGFTASGAVASLVGNSTEAARLLEGGCVYDYLTWYYVSFEVVMPQPVPRLPLNQPFQDFHVGILGRDGTGGMWSFTLERSPLGTTYHEDGVEPFASAWSCDDIAAVPGPRVSAMDFITALQKTPGAPTERDGAFALGRWSSPVGHPQVYPSIGLAEEYSTFFVPANATEGVGVPYTMNLDARTGWWTLVKLSPDDVAAMDRGDWS